MRYSAGALGWLACVGIALTGAAAPSSQSRYFCGSGVIDWSPPWDRSPKMPDKPNLACHLIACDSRKMKQDADGGEADQ